MHVRHYMRNTTMYVTPQPAKQVQQRARFGSEGDLGSEREDAQSQKFWDVVAKVAGTVNPEERILRSGLDSLALTQLFLRIEQSLGVDAAELVQYLGGEFLWKDIAQDVLGMAGKAVRVCCWLAGWLVGYGCMACLFVHDGGTGGRRVVLVWLVLAFGGEVWLDRIGGL